MNSNSNTEEPRRQVFWYLGNSGTPKTEGTQGRTHCRRPPTVSTPVHWLTQCRRRGTDCRAVPEAPSDRYVLCAVFDDAGRAAREREQLEREREKIKTPLYSATDNEHCKVPSTGKRHSNYVGWVVLVANERRAAFGTRFTCVPNSGLFHEILFFARDHPYRMRAVIITIIPRRSNV
ncbi:hypothetical protein Cgig2_009268 [Carnegiea gigantea]|uniref:Uncharacterized protein n=1 Tax=Carnegiea gigantea TaxID=171969 RepID=A0A9Q1Q9U6_9CARY|nr:hypothetical protein Cgig2_009268 [Carnegiea gigantea]